VKAEGEAEMLARRFDEACRKRVQHQRTRARTRAVQENSEDPYPDEPLLGSTEIMVQTPPDQLTWGQLEGHARIEPEAVAAMWQELRSKARMDLAAGGRMVEALGKDTPWERARLLAIRDAFIEEWQPRCGMELALVEQAAYAHFGWLEWQRRANRLGFEADAMERPMERVLAQAMEEGLQGRRVVGDYGLWRFEAARRTEGEAAQMADRFQRMFMRAVRALRDLRRYAPQITIHNRGQVNIGEQQVNVSAE
jgi:hypothetical protein